MALQAPLSWTQVAALALDAGFTPAQAVIATSITQPESNRIQNIVQAGQPYATTGWGLWQITPGNSEPQFGIDDAMLIGLNNAHAAKAKFDGAGGFGPWTTWVNGLNQPYIGAAEQAVSAVTKLSLAQLNALVNSTAGQGGKYSFTPDAALSHLDLIVKRIFTNLNKELVSQHMALNRLGKPGWLP